MKTKDTKSFKSAFKLSVFYLIFGVIWIYYSDNAVEFLSLENPHQLTLLQNYKGWFFIAFTSFILFLLSYRFLHKVFVEYINHLQTLETKAQLEDSLQEVNFMYRSLIDNMLDSVAHCRMIYKDGKPIDYEYLSVNKIFESMTGLHNVVGHTISEFIPQYAVENPDSMEIFGKVASSGVPCKWEHYLKALDQWYNLSIYSPNQGEFIIIAADITAEKKYKTTILDAKERFERLAHHDPLTNLPNRLSLIEMLAQMTSPMENHPFALFFLDLDSFKEINDSYGHRFGDVLLIRVTQILQEIFPPDTFIVRTGGDEFVMLVSCHQDKNEIDRIMHRLIDVLNLPLHIEDKEVYITASIGIAMYPSDTDNAEELLQKADVAMYNAKNMGKNTYSFYESRFTEKALHRTTLSTQLKKALQNNELELYFQPQVDCHSGKIIGEEVLLRWSTPEGMIPPTIFIPIAEESGLILEIGDFVLRQGCVIASRWSDAGLSPGRIAINVSARQLTHINFLTTLDKIIQETHCDPSLIELEITESSILDNPEKTILLLETIKTKGFHISIDDFGTGYSSLSYLKNLPIDKLKIDISFVRNVTHEPKNQTIVKTIIALAKGLNMEVLAEGVESREELEFLRENGIDSIQGYYYHKPMPIDAIEALLRRHI